MGANDLKSYRLFFRADEMPNSDRRKKFDLRRWLRNCYVADVAHLAVLGVRLVRVPVPCRLHGESTHVQNEGYRQ